MSEPIPCPACGFENDATRVFCHNCGVRLPRTEDQINQKAEQNRQATEEAKKVLREGHKKSNKRSIKDVLASAVHALITLGIYAAFAAALILAFRAPENLPPPGEPNEELVRAGERQIEKASRPGFKGTISTSQEQLNDYLVTKHILQSRTVFLLLKAEVQRLFVVLERGDFIFGLEYSLMGQPVFLTANFDITGAPGAFSLELLGGAIGCLPVHPLLIDRALKWYQPVADAFHNQLQILSEAESIAIIPGEVKIVWARPPGTQATEPPRGPDFSAPQLPVSPTQLR